MIMGVDLRLLPFDCDQGEFAYSHTLMEVGRNYDLHDKIRRLRSMPVPKGFTSFCARGKDGEPTYGVTLKTPYGEPLEYVLAGELSTIKLPVDTRHGPRAVWAYLNELPPQTKIALYWH